MAWSDCRFRTGCAENDIVYSSSSDGTTWTAVTRVPIDPTTSTVDHFLPGIGVDPATSGATAHLTVVYYYFPVSECGNSCQLDVGFYHLREWRRYMDHGRTTCRAHAVELAAGFR